MNVLKFNHIDTTKKLRFVKQLLEHYSIDMQMILDAHDAESPVFSNLSSDEKKEINDCLISMIKQLEASDVF